jgi:hypothetical protein
MRRRRKNRNDELLSVELKSQVGTARATMCTNRVEKDQKVGMINETVRETDPIAGAEVTKL